MIEKYTLSDPKPKFSDDQLVLVDMSCFGFSSSSSERISMGKIVGKGSEHIIDFWLIQFSHSFGPTYPYKVVSVPHTFILKQTGDL